MKESLLLHIRTVTDYEASIAAFQSQLSPSDLSDAHPPRLAVLVPAAVVPRLATSLPGVPSHKLRQAAGYAIEDRLIGDVESQHLTIISSVGGRGGSTGDRLDVELATIEREWLSALLRALDAAGLKPSAVYADADCVASKPGDVLLWIDGQDAHWMTPRGLRRTWPVDALDEALDWALEGTPAGTLGLRVYATESDLQKQHELIDALRTRLVSVQSYSIARPLDWLSGQLEAAQPCNLLHDEFAPQLGASNRLQRWRWPLRIAAAIVTVFVAQLVFDLMLATTRARAIEERIAIQARGLLPPGSATANVVPLLERQLGALGARPTHSPTLATLNSLVESSGAPLIALDRLEVQAGRVTLEAGRARPEDRAAWKAAWSAAGWRVTERADAQGVVAIDLVRP